MQESLGGGRVSVELAEGVSRVVLNRPEKLNALDRAFFEALVEAGERLRTAPGLRAVVLSGAGRGFCAGLDLESFTADARGAGAAGNPLGMDLALRSHGIANLFQQAAWTWRTLPVPVIAALHGIVYGGGLQIALGADLRIASPDARLSAMEIRWGIVPDMGGVALLPGLVRADVLRDLVYTGRVVSGEEALRVGLVTRLAADPLEAALEAASAIASRNPDAIRAAKRLLNAAPDREAAEILALESREQAALIGSPNQREAVAANLGNRPPRFADPAS